MATNSVGAPAASSNATAAGPRATIADQVQADPDKFMTLQRMATEQLDAILKDPDTAKFKDAVAVAPPAAHGSVFFCGLVNAKSGFGAYTGYTRFIVAPHTGAWLSNSPGIRFKEVWRHTCLDSYVISKAEFVN